MKFLSAKKLVLGLFLSAFMALSSTPLKAAEECRVQLYSIEKHTNRDVDELAKKFDSIILAQIDESIKVKIKSFNERKLAGALFSDEEKKELNELSAQIEAKYAASKIPGVSLVVYVPENVDGDAINIRIKSRFNPEGLDEKTKEILSTESIMLYYNGASTYDLFIAEDDFGMRSVDDFLASKKSDCESTLPGIEPEPAIGVEVVDQKRETTIKVMEESEISMPNTSSNAAK